MSASGARQIALCGVLTAASVAVMCLGTLIPAATYCCPVLCGAAVALAGRSVSKRYQWAMYGAIALLSLLLAPDKEAAFVFLALGYYPIVRPALEKRKPIVRWCLKLALFYAAIAAVYALLLFAIRPPELLAEANELTAGLAVVMLLLGGVVFVLFDRVLAMLDGKLRRGKR